MTAPRRFLGKVLVATGWLLAGTTSFADSSNPIEELFSTADGRLQFIQLQNVPPKRLAGVTLTASHDGVTQTLVLPEKSRRPAPPQLLYFLVVSESLSRQPIGPSGGADQWDYVMPDGFLPLNGGTITL